jgi:hypothetical protein
MPVSRISRLFFLFTAPLALLLAGCGGSGSRPTPQGGFTVSSLNGSYAFSFSGNDAAGFFAAAGTMALDGAGHITSGILDLNRGTGVAPNIALTGSYSIKADGRGTAILNTATAGNMNLVFVVISSQHALVSRFENVATGSGSMDLSNSGAFTTTALAGSFAFNWSGLDGPGNPEATAGSITLDNTGTLTTGVQDIVDGTLPLTNQPIGAGTLSITTSGRGTLALTTSIGSLTFAIYPVSTNFFKAVEIDNIAQLAGDVFRQQGPSNNTALNGPFAFTIAGSDEAALAPLAVGGVFTSSGTGAITTGTEDQNDGGSPSTNVPISGNYAIAGLRGTLTFTGTNFAQNFVFYPTTGGIQLLEIDSGVVLSGVAFQQSGAFSNASIQGAYGLNLSGLTPGGELDENASLNANGNGGYSGILDANNVFTPTPGIALTGAYTVDATGRGPMTLNSAIAGQNLAVYVVNGTQALFIDLDSGLVAAGQMQHQ